MRRPPDREIIHVLRRAPQPLSRAALFERSRIDDIHVLDEHLAKLTRIGAVLRQADDTYTTRPRRTR